jgi:Ran GTPase-activating protein (RanGAP) involved in mRNA processing and transport
LRVLSIANNALGEAGGTAVAEALGRGAVSHLRVIDLDRNALREAGGLAMAESLGKGTVPQLREIRMSSNELGVAGRAAVRKSLSRGAVPLLEMLYLDDNALAEDALATRWRPAPWRVGETDLGVVAMERKVAELEEREARDEGKYGNNACLKAWLRRRLHGPSAGQAGAAVHTMIARA